MAEIKENLVSTIIPVYNRPQMLKEAVESALSQTYRPIEIIISDDASNDETPEVAESLRRQNPNLIQIVKNQNRGAGAAREAGRLIAQGEFIQYLDSDDRLLPRKFEIQVQALRRNPQCGAAYGYIRFCPPNQPPAQKPYKWSGRELPTLYPWLLVDRWWNTDCPLFLRSITDKVGPWSDLQFSQDWEYDSRVGGLGTKLVHCKEFVCEQRHHGNPRQTGHGDWLKPKDRVKFFRNLFDNAIRAGVSISTPEMQHFSRWVFLNARQCGRMGDSKASKACFELALQASDIESKDLTIYRSTARYLGWIFMGRFTCWIDQMLRRKPGRSTMKQSWMED